MQLTISISMQHFQNWIQIRQTFVETLPDFRDFIFSAFAFAPCLGSPEPLVGENNSQEERPKIKNTEKIM